MRWARTALFVRPSAPASSLTVRLSRRSSRMTRPRVLPQKRSLQRLEQRYNTQDKGVKARSAY